jgi:hypothetical protein
MLLITPGVDSVCFNVPVVLVPWSHKDSIVLLLCKRLHSSTRGLGSGLGRVQSRSSGPSDLQGQIHTSDELNRQILRAHQKKLAVT